MAARGSFQKHQKEIARKEKRQQKLARRQGRTHGPQPGAAAESEPVESTEEVAAQTPEIPPVEQPQAESTTG